VVNQPHEITLHPEYAGRTVSLICGPPGSGKSTLARHMHGDALELESIIADTYPLRLKLFGRMCYRIGRNPIASIGIVRGAPTQVERDHHVKLCKPSRTIVLLTSADVCHQRVTERNRAEVAKEHAAIDAWWDVWRREHATTTSRAW
jgi:energy-coupling factor transporter ATP-binding protein EcfA2